MIVDVGKVVDGVVCCEIVYVVEIDDFCFGELVCVV